MEAFTLSQDKCVLVVGVNLNGRISESLQSGAPCIQLTSQLPGCCGEKKCPRGLGCPVLFPPHLPQHRSRKGADLSFIPAVHWVRLWSFNVRRFRLGIRRRISGDVYILLIQDFRGTCDGSGSEVPSDPSTHPRKRRHTKIKMALYALMMIRTLHYSWIQDNRLQGNTPREFSEERCTGPQDEPNVLVAGH